MTEVQEQLLPALVRLIGAQLAIYHEARLTALNGEYTQVDVVWPDPRAVSTAMVDFGAVAADSPVIAHVAKRPDSHTVVLRQLVSRREWHASPAYDTCLRHLGIEDQVAQVLYSKDDATHGLTLSRSSADFGPRESQLVRLLAPHVSSAIRRARGSGVGYEAVVITPQPRIQWVHPAIPSAGSLTRREREVIVLAARGLTNREVAGMLNIAPRTVDKHLENAYRRLGVSNRVEAALETEALRP
ncbi:LuxR C-terminal-related transcriptional regulator [Microbacterium sp. zg.Y625]|uniref:helix-turn-helix transcriptional regulator n=1 Tax=Microbacterium jiangjiandongii TaxID=3049071 RepID=UPI00214C4682|nr:MULTISPECIES: LuxR family transcriptional regulator [unclassified Microbacterium]MCR2792124.1 LuxR C-terminal-related transcriptional regulator [Microbacterium sp. zg.Y625]MCR2814913.1 LuxR C-terminal-related transcriptional regulator [Microbacterium sp. zg.Y843]WIM24930.1 LuxR C-terminal-related transcriptional regulator [Microbacterium sp. zg-Y625]